jgi:hypothetical protein
MMNFRVVLALATAGLLTPAACGSGSGPSGPRRGSGGAAAGSSGAAGKGAGSAGSAGRGGSHAGRGGSAASGGNAASGGDAGSAVAGRGGAGGGSGNTSGGEGGQGTAAAAGTMPGDGGEGSGGEGGDNGGCPDGTSSCNDDCVDDTKELWLFTGLDGCSVTWSIYLRVPPGAVVTAGQAHDYDASNDLYDCDDDGNGETPSTIEVGEFLEQPFVDGDCVDFCSRGSGFHDTAVMQADSLCFTPSATTLYYEVD